MEPSPSRALGIALSVGKQGFDQLNANKGLACPRWALDQGQLSSQGCLAAAS